MRVKIGNKWYNSDDTPICIQINDTEHNLISTMDRVVAKEGKFGVFPDNSTLTYKEKYKWMEG